MRWEGVSDEPERERERERVVRRGCIFWRWEVRATIGKGEILVKKGERR